MINQFFATKLATSQTFDDKGNRVTVTHLLAKPLIVKRLKTIDKDGYSALVCSLSTPRQLEKEIKDPNSNFKPGDEIKFETVFKPGDIVKVSGLSKGRGYAGVVKRHGFKGVAGQTHGQSDRQRHPGSIGMRTTPGRVWKGHRMAGHFGNVTKTIRNLKIFSFDPQTNQLILTGTVPGSRNSLITLTKNA